MKKNIYGIVKTELYYCWRTYSLTFEWFCPQTAPLWGPLQRAWSSLSSGGGAAWTRCCILWGYMADLPCLLRLSGGEGICAVCQQNKGLTGERTEVLVETKNTKRYIEYSKLLVKLYSCLTRSARSPRSPYSRKVKQIWDVFYVLVQTYIKCEKLTLNLLHCNRFLFKRPSHIPVQGFILTLEFTSTVNKYFKEIIYFHNSCKNN